jgi:ABC-type oligopeptide transport system substrate-binding subunit
MKRAPRITIAAALGTLLLAGLVVIVAQVNRYGSPMLAEANRHKILLLTVGSEPRALDPDLTNGVPEFKIESALFEGLVNSDPKDGSNWIPGVAESWEHSDDYSGVDVPSQKQCKVVKRRSSLGERFCLFDQACSDSFVGLAVF